MEVYVQVTVQVLIILLANTETPTTGGLESIFNQKLFGINPYTLLILSTSWSLVSCVRMHTNIISQKKGISPITTKLFIFFWGVFAILRRILSIIALFLPSLGLFSILHHWRWEQIPYKARLEYNKRGFLSAKDKISFYGLNETIYWTELDHWNYDDNLEPTPPEYSFYTLFSLQTTFIAGLALLGIHFILVMTAKINTSSEFRKRGHYVNKIIHIIENLNYATPFSDWDEGDHTIQEFRARFRSTCREMTAIFFINIVITFVMLVPIWYTGVYNIIYSLV